jgi:hypothetical protein
LKDDIVVSKDRAEIKTDNDISRMRNFSRGEIMVKQGEEETRPGGRLETVLKEHASRLMQGKWRGKQIEVESPL